jgi:Protein of unknown function (DUF1460)
MRFFLVLFGMFLPFVCQAESLPYTTVFKGESTFQKLLNKGRAEHWAERSLGDRSTLVGLSLCGIPYKNYTLEIDNHIEAPSVNFQGLDCWTFFEISLNFARMLSLPEKEHTPAALLRLIENERYRGGKCDGQYLSRIHHLEELFQDNESRGLLQNITASLGGVRIQREVREMTVGWKGYRYLVNNPELRIPMAEIERRITKMSVLHIPKNCIASIEGKLQNGDIIAITSKYDGGYTSHVGLAYREKNGVLRFMHASANSKKVILDLRLSDYVNKYSSNAGIIVARPKELRAFSSPIIAVIKP